MKFLDLCTFFSLAMFFTLRCGSSSAVTISNVMAEITFPGDGAHLLTNTVLADGTPVWRGNITGMGYFMFDNRGGSDTTLFATTVLSADGRQFEQRNRPFPIQANSDGNDKTNAFVFVEFPAGDYTATLSFTVGPTGLPPLPQSESLSASENLSDNDAVAFSVPTPLTYLGSGLGFAFGLLCSREYSRKKKGGDEAWVSYPLR